MRERRANARVAIPLDARLRIHGEEHALVVREISRTGIYLFVEKPIVKVGDKVELELAIIARIRPLVVNAQVLRINKTAGGDISGIGLKFMDMSKQQKETLLELIDRGMQGPGTRTRAYPRVSQFLEIKDASKTQLGVVLRDIGEGGAGLEVNAPVRIGEEVVLQLAFEGLPKLQLSGYVVTCAEAPGSGGNVYQAGVRFGRLDAELRQTLVKFLKALYRR